MNAGVPPLGWVGEGHEIPTLHGVAYRDFMRMRSRTAWLGLHWLISAAVWCFWQAKKLRFQHPLPIDRYLQRRGMSNVCPCCGTTRSDVERFQSERLAAWPFQPGEMVELVESKPARLIHRPWREGDPL